MSNGIDSREIAFYVGGTPVVVGCETTSSFNIAGHLADTKSKCDYHDTNLPVGYSGTISGTCIWVAGDTGILALRSAIIAGTDGTGVQWKTINGQVWTATANVESFDVTASNGDVLQLSYSLKTTSAITFV